MTQTIGVTLLGIASSEHGDAAVLYNMYEMPLDPNEIASCISDQTVAESRFDGITRYRVDEWLTGISSAQGTTFACSMEGSLHVSSASSPSWSIIRTGATSGFNGIHAVDGRRAYAAGLDGSLWMTCDGQAELAMPGRGVRLNAIHGCSPECIYAVGDGGQIIRGDGREWLPLAPPTGANLLAVHCVSPDEVYVGGVGGVAFRWDGAAWLKLESPDISLTGLAMYKGQLYVAGGKDGIYRLEGSSLVQLKTVTIYRLGVANDLLFAIGNSFFAWFNGQQWKGGQLNPI